MEIFGTPGNVKVEKGGSEVIEMLSLVSVSQSASVQNSGAALKKDLENEKQTQD